MAQDREQALVGFAATPFYAEKVISFGCFVCLDSFLHIATIMPLRLVLAIITLVRKRGLPITRRLDLIKGILVLLVIWQLLKLNTSKVYFTFRGQAGLQTFMWYGLIEAADRLCCAVGQDIFDSLSSLPTALSFSRTVLYSVVALLYIFVHSFVLVWQFVVLNVALNRYSDMLLTLMVSEQFNELKAAVFKKIDKQLLFQMTCADITQRFQLFLLLLLASVRNICECNLTSFSVVKEKLGPPFVALFAIIIVDWLKHSYIAKFNSLDSRAVYKQFLSVLVDDQVEQRQLGSSHLMIKRMGLPVLPLFIVCVRMFGQLSHLSYPGLVVCWLVLLVFKICLGFTLYEMTQGKVPMPTTPRSRVAKESLVPVTPYSHPANWM